MWGSLSWNSANFSCSSMPRSPSSLTQYSYQPYFCGILTFTHIPSNIFTCSIIFTTIRLHYDVMKMKYVGNIQLPFSDTGALMYEVCTDDLYQDMWGIKEEFELASYPKSSSFYDPT